jgi:hypothetical protein
MKIRQTTIPEPLPQTRNAVRIKNNVTHIIGKGNLVSTLTLSKNVLYCSIDEQLSFIYLS